MLNIRKKLTKNDFDNMNYDELKIFYLALKNCHYDNYRNKKNLYKLLMYLKENNIEL